MFRYSPYLKGNNVYSECVGKPPLCDEVNCGNGADFSIRGDRYEDDLQHVCQNHLEVKEYRLSGRCDQCARHSFENWLCLVFTGTRTLFKLCKKCHREKRRKKNA